MNAFPGIFAARPVSTVAFALACLVGLNAAAQNIAPKDGRLAADVADVLRRTPNASVAAIGGKGVPTHLRGELARVPGGGGQVTEESVRGVFGAVLPFFRLSGEDLRLDRIEYDELGSAHARYSQVHRGLPVLGAQLLIHINAKGVVYAVNGRARGGEVLPEASVVDAAGARAKAQEGRANYRPAAVGRLIYLLTPDDTIRLVHEVRVDATDAAGPAAHLAYVDAVTGEIILRNNLICTALSRNIYNLSYGTNLSAGTLMRSEGGGATGDAIADTNYDYLGATYNYYSSVFSRNSYDNGGAAINSYVHYGVNYQNAFWDLSVHKMAYGDGDTNYNMRSFVYALDLTGHELTHAVTQYSSNLPASGIPGAINESISDIFGAMIESYNRSWTIDSKTWHFAEDIFISAHVGRYMDDPVADGASIDWYPYRYVDATPSYLNDYGHVHFNNGISNLAFKLMVTGGTHPRGRSPLNVPAQGYDHAQRIIYRANTIYLTSSATFEDFRAASAQAALDLYGNDAFTDTHLAWDAVAVPYVNGNTHPIDLSTRGPVGTGSNIMIAGFTLSGGSTSKSMLVRGVGPTLSSFGVSGVLSNPYLELYSGSTLLDSNDNWGSYSNVSGVTSATSAVGAFALGSGSNDSAILPSLGPGSYTAQISGVSSTTGNALVEIYDTNTSNPDHLSNLSTRVVVNGTDAVAAGFILKGDGYKKLLIRAAGPALSPLGISGYISNPVLTLYRGSTALRTNNDWGSEANASDISSAATTVGAFSFSSGSTDSALLLSLPPGTYTAQVTGSGGATGITLIEVYEVP